MLGSESMRQIADPMIPNGADDASFFDNLLGKSLANVTQSIEYYNWKIRAVQKRREKQSEKNVEVTDTYYFNSATYTLYPWWLSRIHRTPSLRTNLAGCCY
jgi:hypothetical protein